MRMYRYIDKLPGTLRRRWFTLVDADDMLDTHKTELAATVLVDSWCTSKGEVAGTRTMVDIKRVHEVCASSCSFPSAGSKHSNVMVLMDARWLRQQASSAADCAH